MDSVTGVVIVVLILSIIFYLMGSQFCHLQGRREDVIFQWLMGWVLFLGIFSIIDVPLEVIGVPFHVLVYAETAGILGIFALCIYRCSRSGVHFKKLTWHKPEMLTVIFVILILLQIRYGMNNQLHASPYDMSYYNGNAINTLYTDTMYQYDPYTGQYVGRAVEWNDCYSMLIAFLAKVFYMHPLVVVNRVFGVLEIIAANFAVYELAYYLSEKKRRTAVCTMAVWAVLCIMSWNQGELPGFYLWARLAESKSMLANVYLPLTLLGLVLVVKQVENKKNWIVLGAIAFSSVNMSMSGIFIITLMLGGGLLPVLASKRKFRYFVYAALCVLPCIVTGAVRFLQ